MEPPSHRYCPDLCLDLTAATMSALVIALDQPVVTGLVFLLWDMVLLAVFIAGTTRLASYLTKKDMEHGTAVTPKELEVPHVSGGIGSSKPVTQISIICARAVSRGRPSPH